MTALLFYIEPDRVCLAMDTRTLELDDKSGEKTLGTFMSKIFLVPHLRGVICCTGLRSLPFYWHAFVQQSTVAKDMTGLDEIAAKVLPELAAQCGLAEELRATVYHFGYSTEAKEFVARAFRSTNGFKMEALQCPSLGIKPPDEIEFGKALAICEEKGLLDGFIEVMKMQKAVDDAKDSQRRVGIGGEIHFLEMTPDSFTLTTCHRFDDCEQDLVALLHRSARESKERQ